MLNIKGVGVFVNKEQKIIDLTNELNLNYVQLHGEEDNNYIKLKNKKNKNNKKISVSNESD